MTKLAPLAAALLLGVAAVPAAAQGTGASPSAAPQRIADESRGPGGLDVERDYEAQDYLTPQPPAGWTRPPAEDAPATAAGRQYGAPAGDALAEPANPAAGAQEDVDEPGLSVVPETLGGTTARPGAVVVDEPPVRRLDDSGTAATSATIGIRPAPDDQASEDDLERLGAVPDDTVQPAEIDIQRAWKPVDDPPHPDPRK
ncbi:hypothetical protein [Azospirillum sp. A39]|uniref:hypothetical protein n=1 Tax=Azospirillum sp. A39 TaxID=3462279 RepID=UPI004045A7B3